MKILVLGCAGMAGHTISIYLQEKGHEVIGVSREPVTFCHSVLCDVKDTERLKKIIESGEFDSVINCIGVLNQFAENDKATAVFLNAYLPHFLASATQNTKTQIIHMSTDCVFSGERGGYTEDDFSDGKSFYDRTKALGELNDKKNITLRNSIVGPDINQNGIGLLNWFMKQNGEIDGYTKAMWTGLTTLQLAKVMEAAAMEKASGLYNMVYEEPISKYDLLKLFNKYLKNDKIIIKPCDTIAVDKSLKRTNFDFNYLIPDYEIMVSEMASWIKDHRNLYPHYSFD
jgi:dTDP-4-dehydrorhamnose reductase